MPDMDFRLFLKISEQIFPIASDLTLSCMAEPLLYKEFPDVLDVVKNHYFVHSEYVTNGMLLNETIMEKSVEADIKTVQLSFDGAKQETIESIRKGASFNKIIEKINQFNKIKSIHKSKHPVIRFNYVIMKDNITEVEDVIRLAHDTGVEEINFRHLVPLKGLGVKLQSLNYNKQLAEKYLVKAKEQALKLNIKLIGFPIEDSEKTDDDFLNSLNENKCHLPWEQVHILPDGRIIPCPFWYNEKSFGNLHDSSFDAIWNSDDYSRLRWELLTGKWRKICRTCPLRVLGEIYSGNFDQEVQWGPSR